MALPKKLIYELCNLCNLDPEVYLGVLRALDLAEICLLHHGDSDSAIVSEPTVHGKGYEKTVTSHVCIVSGFQWLESMRISIITLDYREGERLACSDHFRQNMGTQMDDF